MDGKGNTRICNLKHTEHRIAMSLAIAALNAQGETTIHRAEAASISYPDFTATLEKICG